MRVIGTAGHVDHGKSTLVTALTGINPDRLKEEQAREMTIELGFAWLTLPDGEAVGIVDVPGHRDFIENMLAGVGGIDAVLFVVAADEGVMPQTREHLAILDILQVPAGIIVLTKCDLIDDPEWFELLEADIRQVVQGTVLEEAPIARVSARNSTGIDMLKHELALLLANCPARPDLGRPRLPIDRVFTMPGFGTVVTGTLLDGHLQVGEEIEILPSNLRGRVRGLQSHKKKEDLAQPGSRTAVNISGVDYDQLKRGDVLTIPAKYTPSQRIDVQFRLQKDAKGSLKHQGEVKFFLGAAEVAAKVRLLGGVDELQPGDEGWLQLELAEPVVTVRGDRYILRRPSPGETLGGGKVVDPHPAGRHKRSALEVIQRLQSLSIGSPKEILMQAWLASKVESLKNIVMRSRLTGAAAMQAASELINEGELILLEEGALTAQAELLAVAAPEWRRIGEAARSELQTFHKSFPLRKGMSREELKNRLKLSSRTANAVLRKLAGQGLLVEMGPLVALAGFTIVFSAQQQAQIKRLTARFNASPFNTPSVKECEQELGTELYGVVVENGDLVQVSPEVVFLPGDYSKMVEFVKEFLSHNPTLTVVQFRDHFSTSRKYALGLLEHLDSLGVTRREGDFRKLAKK